MISLLCNTKANGGDKWRCVRKEAEKRRISHIVAKTLLAIVLNI